MDEKKIREAIEIMRNERPGCGEKIIYTESEKCESYDIAIEALEKQLPKKVEYEDGFSNNGFARYRMAKCPTCDRWYNSNEGAIYCVNCC